MPEPNSYEESRKTSVSHRSFATLRSRLRNISIATRLAVIVITLAAASIALLAVATFSFEISSGVRAYVGGEGLYSKGQKDAVNYLTRYADSHNENDYREFQRAIAIPIGDHKARIELQKPSYDYNVVASGFIAGENAEEDVPNLIFVFRHFHDVSYLVRAIDLWTRADALIVELAHYGTELHDAIISGNLDKGRETDLLNHIDQINAMLTPVEHEFSETLSEGARRIQDFLLATMFITTMLFLSGGLWVSWRISRELRAGITRLKQGAIQVTQGDLSHPIEVRSRDELGDLAYAFNDMIAHRKVAEMNLKESRDQANSIIGTAFDAFIAMDADGLVQDWNGQAEKTFGWSREEVIGQPLAEIIIPAQYRQAHQQGLKRYMQTGEGPILNRRIEITALHRDGHEFPVELSIWATRLGETPRFNAFLHDISDRHQTLRRLAAQKAVAACLVESTTLIEAAPKVLQAICEALGWQVGVFWMPDSTVLRCTYFWQKEGLDFSAFEEITRKTTFTRSTGLPGRVWASNKSTWVADVTLDTNFPRAKDAALGGLHGAFAFPVFSGSEVLGIVEFFSQEIQKPDEDLLRMTNTLGNLLGQFMARMRAEGALGKEQEFLKAMLENLSEGIVACDERGMLSLFNRATREFHGLPNEPLPPEHWAERYDLFLADGQTKMSQEQIPLFRAFQGEFIRDVEIVVAPKDRPRHSLVCNGQAIISKAGEKLGAVIAMHDISERKVREAQIAHLANYDNLTGLPNRNLLSSHIEQALLQAARMDRSVALIFLDLDGFKFINDSFGHNLGDSLLKATAVRLENEIRSGDTVARLGGDEFVIMLRDIEIDHHAAEVAGKILYSISRPYLIDGHSLHVTGSIGISIFPKDGQNAETLLQQADIAMYCAKEAGHDRLQFYTQEMSAKTNERVEIEAALRQALANGEFEMHYQPQFHLKTKTICSVEALIRWQHPKLGMVSPVRFIALAEETGLIIPIGEWALRTACTQLKAWHKAGYTKLTMAINISALQFHHYDVPQLLRRILEDTGIQAMYIHLELTESAILQHTNVAIETLQKLKAMGIVLAMDDFGTGYSSLSYLSRFPIEIIKIDQSFITDLANNPNAASIIRAIIAMAKSLNMKTVAEGVETQEQLDFLKASGCDIIQGFYFSPALSVNELTALLNKRGKALMT